MPCPRFLKREPDSDDNLQQMTKGKRIQKDSDEKYQMTSQRHNDLETTHANLHQSVGIKTGSVNQDRISILKNSISHQLIPSDEKRVALSMYHDLSIYQSISCLSNINLIAIYFFSSLIQEQDVHQEN